MLLLHIFITKNHLRVTIYRTIHAKMMRKQIYIFALKGQCNTAHAETMDMFYICDLKYAPLSEWLAQGLTTQKVVATCDTLSAQRNYRSVPNL